MKEVLPQSVSLDKIIAHLYLCSSACDECHSASQAESKKADLSKCIMLTSVCSEICRRTAALLEKNAEGGREILELCVDDCRKCANECAKHHHEHCQRCADACNRVVALCKSYRHQEVH